jgi:hypothetical protein
MGEMARNETRRGGRGANRFEATLWRCVSGAALLTTVAVAGCSGDDGAAAPPDLPESAHRGTGGTSSSPEDAGFFATSTVAQRVSLPLPVPGTLLAASTLADQLGEYDPASLLRCALPEQAGFDAAIDALGGVPWGHRIAVLEDQSQPSLRASFEVVYYPPAAGAAPSEASVEIVKPDIVAVTDRAALFYSRIHGLLLVDISTGTPTFQCALSLPGQVDQFFFHDGQLVVMSRSRDGDNSHLLHFRVNGTQLEFREALNLGRARIFDSRRFNDKLVFYTDLQLGAAAPPPAATGGNAAAGLAPTSVGRDESPAHRALWVFRLGDTLERESYDTLIDTTPSQALVGEQVSRDLPIDSLVSESRRFGHNMYASDRYFVVTEETAKTYLEGWSTYTYDACTQSHMLESTYEHCWTEFETRPNPDYVPPDNSGGDRSCQGVTLSDCLVAVAKVANETIQVPIGQRCEPRSHSELICDASETRSVEYPNFRYERSTALAIYEYTEGGFVRLDSSVREIITPGLAATDPSAVVPTLTASAEAFDLSVPGSVQSLHFQDGMLYVISEGVLQVYAMGGHSLVRTATLPVVNDSLQSTLFGGGRLYLSDFSWTSRGDVSTLRVVNLANPAFPSVEASTHRLPGGHRSILASNHGIFTIGAVSSFNGENVNRIKLGLFSDPFVEEQAYLILGADFRWAALAEEQSQLFDATAQRALVPYVGHDRDEHLVFRLGVSRVEAAQIESEGAVVLPEAAQRVRAGVGATPSYLSFAANSIEWLQPNEGEWQATPVLEYFEPTAVYRLNEAEDYVEVQTLGNRCRLHFANASDINRRSPERHSEPFDCFGLATGAYRNTLVFAGAAVEFDASARSLRILDADETAEIRRLIAERPICVLDPTRVASFELGRVPRLDYQNLVTAERNGEPPSVVCMSPTEYQERLVELQKPTGQ